MPVENRWTTLAQERFEKLADKLRCDDPEKKDCERACDACREPWNYGEPFGELYGVPPRGPRGQPRVSDTVGAVACTGQGEHPQEVPRECLGLGPEQAPLGIVTRQAQAPRRGRQVPDAWSVLREPAKALAPRACAGGPAGGPVGRAPGGSPAGSSSGRRAPGGESDRL